MGSRPTLEKIEQPLRVLITGGFGYLGGRVAQYLTECGYQVVLGSREKKNKPEWLNQAEVIQLKWDDEDALVEACNNVNFVIHASGMNAHDCATDPVAALEFNGLATTKLVRASQKAGVTKFIYLSTAHVYRSPLTGNINENTCPSNLHPYATSHLSGEKAVLYASNTNTGFTGIVLRLSNVVGAPVSKSANCWMLFVNDICKEVVVNNSITIRNNSNDVRDFVPMSLVNMLCRYLVDEHNSEISEIYNVCSGESMTFFQMASLVKERYMKLYNISPELILQNTDNEIVGNICFDSDKLPTMADVELEASLSSEIDSLLKYCALHFR